MSPDRGWLTRVRHGAVLPGALLLLGLLVSAAAWLQGQADETRPVAEPARIIGLQVGQHRITAEIADTPRGRALGLMYRDWLAPDHGMLFVFDRAGRHCMFMRNTRIPLSAAFLDHEGRILAIARMQPLSEDLHCAPQPVVHILEMQQGWFAGRNIGVGDRIEGIDAAPSPSR